MELRLKPNEKRIIELLSRSGAMTPSEIAVQTLMPPAETFDTLEKLKESGYIVLRETPTSPDGQLVILTSEVHERIRQQVRI
ncbi:MAG: MarR family transcriptional regulator [Chloroflexia bacterium]